jgi:signal transduction histidine kinase/CheY-like chemotaxis protein
VPTSTDAEIVSSVVDELPVGVWVARAPGGEFVYANRTFAEIMGMPALGDVARGEYAEPYGIYTRDGRLYPEEQLPFVRALQARAVVTVDDIVIHRRDGRKVNVRALARPVFAPDGDPITHVVIAFFDITREVEAERLRAESEERLHRAQRMEAIGSLAGGIAHDFNNLLTAIRAVATKLSLSERDPERRQDLRVIDEVASSAADLTRALLGFAGRGKNFSESVSLNEMVTAMAGLIERTLHPIDVTFELDAHSGDVAGDLSQLEQVLMNLVLNARDAMPNGGRLVLRTRDAGEQVIWEVADSGVGIDAAIRERIFEPYFTTKQGRGSGLGLATVYGIVEAHGGRVEAVDGSPGTTMRIALPAAAPGIRRARRPSRSEEAPRAGQGLVLLVEDEPLVRVSTFRALRQLGYEVLACSDGLEALDLYREHHGELTAVVLDMIMPRMSGRATYVALRDINPRVPVLLTSGFAGNEEVQQTLDLGARGYLPKPYDLGALSTALDKLTDGG